MDAPPPDDAADDDRAAAEKASLRERAAVLRGRAQELGSKAQERLEVEQGQRGWVRTAVQAFDADRNRGGGLLAGGLAYRIFIWELPAMLFVVSLVSVISTLLGQSPVTTVRRTGMAAEVANAIAEAVGQGGSTSWWWLLIVGSVLTLWAGRGAVKALWLISQIAWQQRAPRPSSLKGSVAFSGLVLAGLAVPLVVSATIQGPFWVDIAAWLLGTIVVVGLALVGASLLPRGGRPWTAIMPGVVLFAVVLRVIAIGSAVYFGQRLDSIDDLYGALGVAIVIQLWLYVMARLYVGGQFLNATIAGVDPGRLGDDLAGHASPASVPD